MSNSIATSDLAALFANLDIDEAKVTEAVKALETEAPAVVEETPVKKESDSIHPVKKPEGRSDRDLNEKQTEILENDHNLVVFEDDTDIFIRINKTGKVSGSNDRRPICGTFGAQLNRRAYIKEGITKVVKNQTKLVPDIKEDKHGNWIMDDKAKFPKTLTFSNAVTVPMENGHQLKLELTAFYGKARKTS